MDTYVKNDIAWKQRIEKEIICKLRSKGATFNPEILKTYRPQVLYASATGNPNLMTTQDFVPGKQSNYFLVRTYDGFFKPATLPSLSEVPEKSIRNVDENNSSKKAMSNFGDAKSDYIGMSKVKRKKIKVSSKHAEAPAAKDEPLSTRFNEEPAPKPFIRKIAQSPRNNKSIKVLWKTQTDKDEVRSVAKSEANMDSLKSEIMARMEKMSEQELEDMKQKTLELTQHRDSHPQLTVEAVKKLDAASSRNSARNLGSSRRSETVTTTYVSQLEKQLDEERQERKKLEFELDEIKKMVTTFSKSFSGQFPK